MTTMSLRPRGIGEILDGAFRLYKEDIGLYVLTATLGALPWAVVMVGTLSDSDRALALSVVFMMLALLLTIVVWAALMHQMNERLQGGQPALGPSVKRGLSLSLRVTWGSLLAYMVLAGSMMVWGAGAAIAGAVGSFVHPIVGVILGLGVGIALLYFVFLRATAGAALFLPGIVVEERTGFDSVKRGFALSKQGTGRIIAVLFVSWVLVFVPLMASYFITGTTATLMDPEAIANGMVSSGQLAIQQLLAVVASGFTTPFLVACILLVHYDQRVRLEAFDLEAEADALSG